MSVLAEFAQVIDGAWLSLEPVRVGSVPAGLGTPDVYVTVGDGEEAVLRIDVYGGGAVRCFSDVCVWGDWVVVGFGDKLHLVRWRDGKTLTYEMDWYFGHMYPQEGRLIVASARRLFCFGEEGNLLWRSEELGIDGVVVSEIAGGRIFGEGECDPPGGWRGFEVDVVSGKVVKGG